MNKKQLLVSGVVVIALLVWGAYIIRQSKSSESEKVTVAASIYPLVFISERVGGDRVQVKGIVPAGVEAHDFEPAAQDLISLLESDVVVLNGRGLEAWAESIISDINPDKTRLVLASEKLAVARTDEYGDEDPHTWLNPSLLSLMAEQVAEALIVIDPMGKSEYEKNLLALQTELAALHNDYQIGLAECNQRAFITSHAAFGYLADAYNLEQIAISGLEPSEEPSARQLAEIAKLAQEKEIHYIFFETLTSPELAEVLASEVGAATLVLNPLESLSERVGQVGPDYLSEMKNNLNNLRMALECKIN